jgi:hypothetical protein
MAEEAAALDAEAREHKRQERFHRRAAVRAREDLREIRAACDELGIELVIGDDDDHIEPEEVQSGGRKQHPRT